MSVRHAGDLLSRYGFGANGKTAHERLRGKKFQAEEIEVGENAHYQAKTKS